MYSKRKLRPPFAIQKRSLNLYCTQTIITQTGPVLEFLNISHLFSMDPSFPKLLSFLTFNLRSVGAEHVAVSRPLCWVFGMPGTWSRTQGSETGNSVPGALSPLYRSEVGMIPGTKRGEVGAERTNGFL